MKRRILLSILCLIPSMCQAEWYAAGDVYQNWFTGPQVDGTWKQDRIPNGSQFDGNSTAFGGGIGYRFDNGSSWLSQQWAVETGYTKFGSADVGGYWVSDENYQKVNENGLSWLDHRGVQPKHYMLTNHLQGGYLRATKGIFEVGGFEPYVLVGTFGAHHTVNKSTSVDQNMYSGIVLGVSIGGGLRYNLYQGIKLRGGAESFWVMSESQNPVSNQWLMLGGGIEVPLQ